MVLKRAAPMLDIDTMRQESPNHTWAQG